MEEILALVNQALDIAKNGKSLLAAGIAIAIVKLLVDFCKTSWGQKLTAKITQKYVWLRPIIANVLGFLGGAITALAAHKPWLVVFQAGLAGLGVAWGAIGFHETVGTASSKERARKVAMSAVNAAMKAGDADVAAKIDVVKANLESAKSLTGTKARLRALAGYANANPPAAGAVK